MRLVGREHFSRAMFLLEMHAKPVFHCVLLCGEERFREVLAADRFEKMSCFFSENTAQACYSGM